MIVTMIIITSLILVVTLVVTVLFFKRWIGFCRVALAQVGEVLGSEPVLNVWNVSASVHGRIQSRPLSVKFTNQTRSSPPTVTVSIPTGALGAFTVRKRNFFDRWCVAAGLASPMVTEDIRFDQDLYMDTGDRERLNVWLSDLRFREALSGLFHGDVMRVVCDGSTLSLVRKLPPREAVPPSLVFNALHGLWEMAECMTPMSHAMAQWAGSKDRIMMRWGLTPGLLFMGGAALLIVGMTLYEPLYPSFLWVLLWALPWSLTAAAFYGLCAWLFVRLRTDRHIIMLAILAFAIPGWLLGAMGWRHFGNGWLDTGSPVPQEAEVWEALNKGRGGRKIVFMVDGKRSAEFSRPKGQYPRGLPVQLTLYPGHYHIPWVARWEVSKKRP